MKPLNKEAFLKELKCNIKFNKRYGLKNITEGKQVLPPCHYGFQVYTRKLSMGERRNWCLQNNVILEHLEAGLENEEDDMRANRVPTRAISLIWNQRSVDVGLGLPYNIASYGLLLSIIAKEVNMVPDMLVGSLGDTHIYNNHKDGLKEQLTREPYDLPTLVINDEFWNPDRKGVEFINNLEISDFYLNGYENHPNIKLKLSN